MPRVTRVVRGIDYDVFIKIAWDILIMGKTKLPMGQSVNPLKYILTIKHFHSA